MMLAFILDGIVFIFKSPHVPLFPNCPPDTSWYSVPPLWPLLSQLLLYSASKRSIAGHGPFDAQKNSKKAAIEVLRSMIFLLLAN